MVKLNLGSGPQPLKGFVNLDANTGWRFEDGLGDYPDGSVEAITVGHALMYVELKDWPAVFQEFARVLASGGIVRVTEDSTGDPASERFGGWHDAVTLTTPELVRAYLKDAGFRTRAHTAESTGFKDGSLLQAFHGPAPKCFWIEGRKP